MTVRQKSLEHVLKEALSQALLGNLLPLQRIVGELQDAHGELTAAMQRAQAASCAIATGISVLSDFLNVGASQQDIESTRAGMEEQSFVAGVADKDVAEFESLIFSKSQPQFDPTKLPLEMRNLHIRANRVAKMAMQEIKLSRPTDVQLGRQNRDICSRLRIDLDKARTEYDGRFNAILDHPIDYFYRWMVEVLAEGDAAALGDYPYRSSIPR